MVFFRWFPERRFREPIYLPNVFRGGSVTGIHSCVGGGEGWGVAKNLVIWWQILLNNKKNERWGIRLQSTDCIFNMICKTNCVYLSLCQPLLNFFLKIRRGAPLNSSGGVSDPMPPPLSTPLGGGGAKKTPETFKDCFPIMIVLDSFHKQTIGFFPTKWGNTLMKNVLVLKEIFWLYPTPTLKLRTNFHIQTLSLKKKRRYVSHFSGLRAFKITFVC